MVSNRLSLARPITVMFCSAALFLALSFSCGCSRKTGGADGQAARTITVAAAANLTDAFAEVGRRFTERTGIEVVFSYGATADLAKQIENGAPFDLFASADVTSMDGLVDKGLVVPESRRLFARGRLVLWAPENGRVSVNRVEDLERADVTIIAIAKPEVAPYGKAAVEALRNLNLWPRLESRVVYATNVAQAKQFTASGNADAAFIPLSLVRAGEGSYIEIESRLHAPLDQAMGVIEASNNKDSARSFGEFVLSDEGQSIMGRFGYVRSIPNE
ncbi:MAG TPA: molybdate ABC transporter substrate-binding protein [Blastocatellia bacterium]|nr:molybdate ABC transporter substrate-binding protein [Blastocatellia bacterium]